MIGAPFFRRARWALAGVLLLCLLFVSGCLDEYPEDLTYGLRTDKLIVIEPGKAEPPTRLDSPGEFKDLMEQFERDVRKRSGEGTPATVELSQLEPQKRTQLNRILNLYFGRPARPRVRGLDDATLTALRLDDDTLYAGSKLYRRHCLHCHGLTGNGQGPTGPWVNPHPRDYRLGQFKFLSSVNRGAGKPRRDDLIRTLTQGIEGTSMPTFALLNEDELQKLVSYVIHLSLRGQIEAETIKAVLADKTLDLEEFTVGKGSEGGLLTALAQQWIEADKAVLTPENHGVRPGDPKFADSVKKGRDIFLGTACKSCHFEFGQRPNLFYDNWGTIVRPANLTLGVYRGGRRPIDLFWRIRGGIPGSNMPGSKPEDLKTEQIWDIVNFLQTLPYRSERDKPEYGIKLYEDGKHRPDEKAHEGGARP